MPALKLRRFEVVVPVDDFPAIEEATKKLGFRYNSQFARYAMMMAIQMPFTDEKLAEKARL